MIRRALICLVVLAGCCTCAAPSDDDARTAWLRSTLLADNRLVILRFPEPTKGKFAKMAATPYNYMRGTAAQAARDITRPGPYQRASRYATPAAHRRAILGDAHLENVGSYLASGQRLLVDFNDFDAATFGPYYLDVWRLCSSIGVAFPDVPEALRARWMRAVARGYADAIGDLAAGGSPRVVDEAAPTSVIFADLLRRAREDGELGDKLATYTRLREGERVMMYGEVEPPGLGFVGDIVQAPTRAQREALVTALAVWRDSLVNPSLASKAACTVKGLSERLGAGVSSYPLPRFYALLEGPTSDPADDWLLEIKEAGDPLIIEGLRQYPWPRWASNAERVVDMQRRLQLVPDVDPLLGQAENPPQSFRVRHRVGFQKNISVSRLRGRYRNGRWTDADLEATFAAMGALLGRAHGGATGLDGERGAPVIAAAIGGDAAGFAAEAVDFALPYAQVILADYERFKAMRADDPLLGYRPDSEHF